MEKWYEQYQQGDYQEVYNRVSQVKNPLYNEEGYGDVPLIYLFY